MVPLDGIRVFVYAQRVFSPIVWSRAVVPTRDLRLTAFHIANDGEEFIIRVSQVDIMQHRGNSRHVQFPN